LGLLAVSSLALAKGYRSGELITTHQYGFGAFEARIRAARGPGVISTFFLWRPGSENSPAVPWHEIDFELGIAAGDYQTQIMTPGSSAPLYRTEHVVVHDLLSRPWDGYHTYRIEWTPEYMAFFVDGVQVRRETDHQTYAAVFAQDASGQTPSNERMELRTGVWPGDTNITDWAGLFDGSSVPTAHYVDYVKVWAYTPGQSNPFATLLLDDGFERLDTGNWYSAQWTFEFSASDYVPQNIGVRNGVLTVALTTEAGQGSLPQPPPDTPPERFLVSALDFSDFLDTTPGNFGASLCSNTDVDAELTSDRIGGFCNIGWTDAGEWLRYDVPITNGDNYDITLRIASDDATRIMHLEVDGLDVSGPIQGPGAGWQGFVDATIPGIALTAGTHSVRAVFDTGLINLHYLAFASTQPGGGGGGEVCPGGCDDGNPCTTDTCDPIRGCQFQANTQACADDGSTCTADVCSGGTCTHPSNGSCTAGASPCAGSCSNPVKFGSANFSSGNLGTNASCYETTAALNGGVCGNFASKRKLTVNGTAMSCTSNWPNPLPGKRNGGYCIQTTAGNYPWAYFVTW
jgi:hypothetical protein